MSGKTDVHARATHPMSGGCLEFPHSTVRPNVHVSKTSAWRSPQEQAITRKVTQIATNPISRAGIPNLLQRHPATSGMAFSSAPVKYPSAQPCRRMRNQLARKLMRQRNRLDPFIALRAQVATHPAELTSVLLRPVAEFSYRTPQNWIGSLFIFIVIAKNGYN